MSPRSLRAGPRAPRVVAGSGTSAGSCSRSTASSQPGTRRAVGKRRDRRGGGVPVDPSIIGSSIASDGDQVGDVGSGRAHRGGAWGFGEAGRARWRLGRASGAPNSPRPRRRDSIAWASPPTARACLQSPLEVVDQRLHRGCEPSGQDGADFSSSSMKGPLGRTVERLLDGVACSTISHAYPGRRSLVSQPCRRILKSKYAWVEDSGAVKSQVPPGAVAPSSRTSDTKVEQGPAPRGDGRLRRARAGISSCRASSAYWSAPVGMLSAKLRQLGLEARRDVLE